MKKLLSALMGLSLLSLAACSSEEKEKSASQEVTHQEEAEPAKEKELNSITQVAENEAVNSELEKSEKPENKEV